LRDCIAGGGASGMERFLFLLLLILPY
jgi:hypothetical protein